MNITQLISKLVQLRAVHGDLDVWLVDRSVHVPFVVEPYENMQGTILGFSIEKEDGT